MKLSKKYFFSGILILQCIFAYSQLDSAQIAQMSREEIMNLTQDQLLDLSMENLMFLAQKLGVSIDDLLKMKTTVASKAEFTPRETPGIISIITEEEIKYSGARDLIDILRLVPGFDFGYDVQGVIGVGLRGNWVHEGKILLLVDGQEWNESSYNNLEFGNHFPVDQIKRIEIIRGPGSAIYGGNAELGVINIITKSGEEIQGAGANFTYGRLQESDGRMNLDMLAGTKVKDWDISVKGFIGNANRSDQPYYKPFDKINDTIDFSKGGSTIKTNQFDLGVSNEKLSLRLIYDDYKTEYIYYDPDLEQNYFIYEQFRNIMGEVKYTFKINDKLSLVPKLNYKFSRPFYEDDYWRNFHINRYQGNLTLNYKAGKKTDLVAGIEVRDDIGECIEDTAYFFYNNRNTLTILNTSVFAEGIFKLNKINLIVSGRVDQNQDYGWAFAPRLGITGVFNKFHFKTLISAAYRSPSIGNIDVSTVIKPEHSLVSEIELGYKLNDNMLVTANFFDISIFNTILYFETGNGEVPVEEWGYKNAKRSGTDGFELEYRAKYLKGFAAINYSHYTLAFKSVPALYNVPGHDNYALGLTPDKLNVYGSYTAFKNFTIGPSFTFVGKKFSDVGIDADSNLVVGKFEPYLLFNLSLTYEDVMIKGLDLQLSAFDILNTKPYFLHPYSGWTPPYPGPSREIVFKISLNSEFLKKQH